MKKCCIEFHLSDYKLFLLLIFPTCEIFNTKIREHYLKEFNEFFLIFLNFLSYFFSLIFIIIIKFKTRKNNKRNINIKEKGNDLDSINDTENKNNKGIINIEIKKGKKAKKIKSLVYILVLSIINLIYSYFNSKSYFEKRTIGMGYKILLFFLLSFIILKYKYAKHHYITFGINALTLFTKYILNIIFINSSEYVLKHIWFYFIYSISFCFLLTIGKYYMDKYYISPHFIMFTIGIFLSVILVIVELIIYLTCHESKIFSGFQDNINGTENIFWLLGDIITQFGMYLGLWITVYYFTPCHTIISENIMEIVYYIIDFKKNEDVWKEKNINLNLYIFPFIHVINFICSLVFNEIIVLNFCGLDYQTKLRIKEREIEDNDKLIKILNEKGNLSSSAILDDDLDSVSNSSYNKDSSQSGRTSDL